MKQANNDNVNPMFRPVPLWLLILAFMMGMGTAYGLVKLFAWEPDDAVIGQASVIDGDTIEIRGQRIRLHGIDAVEDKQHCQKDGKLWRCGREAAMALADQIGKKNVTCIKKGMDRWKRTIGICRAGPVDLNAWMVRNGWALAFRRYSKAYVAAERLAKEKKAGLWQGEFIPPWEWREQKRKGK